ncbi:HAMP domain-containing histidine kinase [Pistricoccus aurantiacus]|uniref:histidine kinase n=1 Tax=Pistricoccus aurantiacus TaxID=1883414 RepID=A0A5B8SVI0_9GAMM|nr:HAMP domain-containing sensor histidine kinase [Pistricoccus aurantiacus]QEA39515.1 HAMP domain-containing histidine kinase [Pistricoccus aurantiacus]
MDRGNVLSGAAFSAVLLSTMVFLSVLLIMGVVAHGYIQRSVTQDIREDLQARWELFAVDYHDEGAAPLIVLIESTTLASAKNRQAVGLFAADGTLIAGNVKTLPDTAGWQEAPLHVAAGMRADDHSVSYLYRSEPLDDMTLVVGEAMDRTALIQRTMFRALAISGFIVVLIMLWAGYIFSRKSLRKLERLETTLARVSDGDMSARMALSSDNDQIDRIARRMNAHLDALSRLMVTTRTTAAAVAHDLKTPLARAYLGLGRALTRVEAGEDPSAEIEDTQAELEGMNGIFDTFLRLVRIEAGGDGAGFVEVDLAALLDDLVETYQVVAEENGQRFVYERPDDERLVIIGDAAMLRQMIVNLLQNAVTHCPEGAEIHLRLDREAERIRLTLADTGPGVPDAAREAVFEPFHRLDSSRGRPGSGLGLTLVRTIAERHGARITLADNAPGLRVVVEFAFVEQAIHS